MTTRPENRPGERLRKRIVELAASIGRPVRIMEVCGTHTVSLRRSGVHSLLPEHIRLISGPGCPVCVTPVGYIDNAFTILDTTDASLITFGDMVKVPGSDGRTLSEYLGSGRVRVVYSPLQVAEILGDGPTGATPSGKGGSQSDPRFVFLAIGFETTIPTVLRAAEDAYGRNDRRISWYTAFKTVPPALRALLSGEEHGIDGFLLPGHVSVIIGEVAYEFLPAYGVPGVITGFEPVEMLAGICSLLESIAGGAAEVKNAYPRVVRREGNRRAQELMAQMLEPTDATWRGLGQLPASGLAFRDEYAALDARRVYSLAERDIPDPPGCRCGEVISGRCLPTECGHFGTRCTPEDPVGPCMVSSEGTCAAYLRYGSERL